MTGPLPRLMRRTGARPWWCSAPSAWATCSPRSRPCAPSPTFSHGTRLLAAPAVLAPLARASGAVDEVVPTEPGPSPCTGACTAPGWP